MIDDIDKVSFDRDAAIVRLGQVGGEHYKVHRIQPWDIIDEYGLDFYEGSCLKYILRTKGGPSDRITDLKKALHYIEKKLTLLKGQE